mgnify:CR=1 FL=1
MKRLSWFKMVALAAALGILSTSCAWILHPERRNSGRTSGRIDTLPLIFDILWFIPGIIPGVVALIVDFTTGAIYVKNDQGHLQKADPQLAEKIRNSAEYKRLAKRVGQPSQPIEVHVAPQPSRL